MTNGHLFCIRTELCGDDTTRTGFFISFKFSDFFA